MQDEVEGGGESGEEDQKGPGAEAHPPTLPQGQNQSPKEGQGEAKNPKRPQPLPQEEVGKKGGEYGPRGDEEARRPRAHCELPVDQGGVVDGDAQEPEEEKAGKVLPPRRRKPPQEGVEEEEGPRHQEAEEDEVAGL